MVYTFTSAAIVYDYFYIDTPTEPETDFHQLTMDNLLPSEEEYKLIGKEVTKVVVDIVNRYLPLFSFTKKAVLGSLHSLPVELNVKTKVIHLPCLPFNEQKHQDDIEILEWY